MVAKVVSKFRYNRSQAEKVMTQSLAWASAPE